MGQICCPYGLGMQKAGSFLVGTCSFLSGVWRKAAGLANPAWLWVKTRAGGKKAESSSAMETMKKPQAVYKVTWGSFKVTCSVLQRTFMNFPSLPTVDGKVRSWDANQKFRS